MAELVSMNFGERVQYFVAEEGGAAESSIRAYFHPGAFSGAKFEKYAKPTINVFKPSDIVAVSMLSVDIPPRVSDWVLDNGANLLTGLLASLGPNPRIEDDVDLLKGSIAWQLWQAIYERWGMGETKTSKLLAAKRPNLFPIFDTHVAAALSISESSYWQPWQKFMQSPQGRECAAEVLDIAKRNSITGVSALRLLDVVIWMRQHGHKSIKSEYLGPYGSMIAVSYADPTD